MGLSETVFLVGFDSNVATVDGLQEGSVDALIVQDVYKRQTHRHAFSLPDASKSNAAS